MEELTKITYEINLKLYKTLEMAISVLNLLLLSLTGLGVNLIFISLDKGELAYLIGGIGLIIVGPMLIKLLLNHIKEIKVDIVKYKELIELNNFESEDKRSE